MGKKKLLAELNRLVENNSDSLAIVFEGRDSAGKSGTIKMLSQYLPPKLFSIEHSKNLLNALCEIGLVTGISVYLSAGRFDFLIDHGIAAHWCSASTLGAAKRKRKIF